MKNKVKKWFGLGLYLVSFPTFASDALETQMLAVLNQIQSQLQTLTTQQAQLAQIVEGYSKMEIQRLNPLPPPPLWGNISPLSPSSRFLKSGGQFFSGASSADQNTSQVVSGIQLSLPTVLPDSGVANEISIYQTVTFGGYMTQGQSDQLTHELLLLNAKASYLSYQEGLRLEELLGAQLSLQSMKGSSHD